LFDLEMKKMVFGLKRWRC